MSSYVQPSHLEVFTIEEQRTSRILTSLFAEIDADTTSVPCSKIEFVMAASGRVAEPVPDIKAVPFGHDALCEKQASLITFLVIAVVRGSRPVSMMASTF